MLAEVTSIFKANVALDSDATCNLFMKKWNMGLERSFFLQRKTREENVKVHWRRVANEFK